MKKILTVSLLAIFVILGILSFKQVAKPVFYYTFSTKKMLKIHPGKVVVRYREKMGKQAAQLQLKQLAAGFREEWVDDRTVIMNLSDKNGAAGLAETLGKQPDVVATHPVYIVDEKDELGLTDEFIVQFHDGVRPAYIDSLNNAYHVSVLKKTTFYYLLQAPAHANAMDIANRYQETGVVNFSHPNFVTRPQVNAYIPNDPYFSSQWNFNNTGQTINDGHTGTPNADINAPEAWDISKGNNSIIVAVLDEGVTSNHPDLPNTRQVRLNGSNFGDGDPNNPSPTGDMDHGNSCAGLIAATQDNNEGISGLAPLCRIMPIRIFNSGNTGIPANRLADALTFAYQNGAAVLSNSWGYNSADPNLFPVIVAAIQNATTQGRGGRGSVVVFSAGNTAWHSTGNNGVVNFPGNVNIPGVLTVGASDRFDRQSDYSPSSNPGSGNNQIIDVVAPSHRAYPQQNANETMEVWSIDIPGNTGYNPWPADPNIAHPPVTGEQLPSSGTNFDAYTGRFGGTSAACPQVSGLAALILSVNPNLTQQQVFNIITGSADKVGGYTYTNGVSNELGNGRINAFQALQQTLSTITPTFANGNPNPVCGDATANFSINPVPFATSYTWTITSTTGTGAVLFTANNQATFTTTATTVSLSFPYWDNYYCTLTARANFGPYSSSAGSLSFSYNQYPVQWTPQFSWNYCSGHDFDVSVTGLPGAVSYYWYIDGFMYDVTSLPNSICAGMYNGERVLTVVANTACGQSPVMGDNIPCAFSPFAPLSTGHVTNVTLYPNPATTSVTVNLLPVQPQAKDTKTAKGPAKTGNKEQQPIETIRQILVLDKMGNRKGFYQYPSGVKTATINVSHLPKDVYYLQISDGVHQNNLPLIKTE